MHRRWHDPCIVFLLIFRIFAFSVPENTLVCPFCGLLCDDLSPILKDGRITLEPGICARAEALFAVPAIGVARLAGQPAGLPEAYRAAARLLAAARRPLIGGLSCDVTGHRAAIALAERMGGVLDHMDSRAQFRNTLAFQDGGWITTTLSEVRNRAELIVLAGTDASAFPRFFERCVLPESQFDAPRPRIVVLSGSASSGEAQVPGADPTIPCQSERLGEVFAALRSRLAGHRLDAAEVAGVPLAQLDALLADMKAARYGVLVWNAAELDFPQADLTVQAMVDLVKDLNVATRWSGLPLGGNDGSVSAAQVCTWQTGYPLRTAFDAGGPHYQAHAYAEATLLENESVDALLWISAFDPARVPPAARCPSIVLGRADMVFEQPPAVFIPVAVPGVQQTGFLHRMDAVVALPLSAPAASDLPSVAQALAAIQQEMNHAAA